MSTSRRHFLTLCLVATAVPSTLAAEVDLTGEPSMYGLIGQIKATPGQRDALIEILLGGTADMPGCLSYVIARDPKDADGIWVTEVWENAESHKASLGMPAVQDAITRGRPLIAGFEQRVETEPAGGHGLG